METAETLGSLGERPAQRDGHGRWVPGQSGNPAGKPPGTRHYATLLKEKLRAEDADKAIQTVIDKAAGGHFPAARFVCDHIDPKPKGRPLAFVVDDTTDVPQLLDASLRAVAGGETSVDEGLALLRYLRERHDLLSMLRRAAAEQGDRARPAAARATKEPTREPARHGERPSERAAAAAPRPASATPPGASADSGLSPEFHLNLQARRGASPPRLNPTLLATTALASVPKMVPKPPPR
jgi:hypothetical protein